MLPSLLPDVRPQEELAILDASLAEIARSDTAALERLYTRTYAAVYGFALSILKNPQDAEDVLQETYIQVWQGAGRYQSQGKPMAWLMTITRNLAMSRLRERGKELVLSPEDWQVRFDGTPGVTQEDRLTLEVLLAALNDQERQIVMLHASAGLKHREIAQLLGIPLSTVLSKYNRSMKKMKQAWKEAEQNA